MALNHSTLAPHALMHLAMASAKAVVSVANGIREIPIAAVLIGPAGETLATAHNLVETQGNPLAHAEMLVLQAVLISSNPPTLKSYLQDCTLAVTLEPCAMCIAALCHARVGKVIFGAYDPKSGGTVNGARVPQHMHFKPEILGGIEEEACRDMLQSFFKTLR